jgi:hypothetical protein
MTSRGGVRRQKSIVMIFNHLLIFFTPLGVSVPIILPYFLLNFAVYHLLLFFKLCIRDALFGDPPEVLGERLLRQADDALKVSTYSLSLIYFVINSFCHWYIERLLRQADDALKVRK